MGKKDNYITYLKIMELKVLSSQSESKWTLGIGCVVCCECICDKNKDVEFDYKPIKAI